MKVCHTKVNEPTCARGRRACRVIDPAILRTDPDRLRDSQRRRGEDVAVVDELVAADVAKRQAHCLRWPPQSAEGDRQQMGGLQGALKKAGDGDRAALQGDVDALMAIAQVLSDQVKAAEASRLLPASLVDALWLRVSNLVSLEPPVGGEDAFEVLEIVGTPRDFAVEGFAPRDHPRASGSLLGAIDMERGAKGVGLAVLPHRAGSLLEIALLNLAMQQAVAHGRIPMITTPSLVLPSAMEGTGFLGQAAEERLPRRGGRPLPLSDRRRSFRFRLPR